MGSGSEDSRSYTYLLIALPHREVQGPEYRTRVHKPVRIDIAGVPGEEPHWLAALHL